MSFLTIPSTTADVPGYPPADTVINFKYKLDPVQQHAVMAIHRNDNVLISAPTGTGKTTVAEYQIAYSIARGQRVFYTTPIKSLSNQKFHDLKHMFPHASVGIMTGDIKCNPEADIVVMTAEILRNLLFKHTTSTATLGIAGTLTMERLGAVVMDEVHYINDPDRGHVWEETIILLPPTVRLVLLSATIDSPDVFAAWIGNAKQHPIMLLKTTHRIVPLIHGLYVPQESGTLPLVALKDTDNGPFKASNYTEWLKGRAARAKAADDWAARVSAAKASGDTIAGAAGKVKLQSFTHQMNECISTLHAKNLLPALFFVFSRKECERYADQVTETLLDSSEAANVKHIMDFHLHRYKETLQSLPQYHQVAKLLERGIAFHHSGLLPLLKEVVELLFSKGYVKLLFCTETFAVGLNMPARTVVFLDLKKPADNGGFRCLRPDEYIQMAGRAGRRGKDTQGIVLYLPSRTPVEPEELRGILTGALKPLESRMEFHYDFLLKAIHVSQSGTKPIWDALVDASYWQEQRRLECKATQDELDRVKDQQAKLPLTAAELTDLKQLRVIEEAVKTSVNATKRKAQQELNQWKDRHMGPKWVNALAFFKTYERCEADASRCETAIANLRRNVNDMRIAPILKALEDMKMIESARADLPCLTPLGVLATEINEANPILMARLYDSKLLHTATLQEIVAVLGALIVDREAEEKSVHPRGLPLVMSDTIRNTLLTLDDWGHEGQQMDARYGVNSPETYWSLTTLWTMIGYDWVGGMPAADLVRKYEIYEGNLMKGLMKLYALTSEWTTLATYRADVDMLTILAPSQTILLRDIAVPESLYLRL